MMSWPPRTMWYASESSSDARDLLLVPLEERPEGEEAEVDEAALEPEQLELPRRLELAVDREPHDVGQGQDVEPDASRLQLHPLREPPGAAIMSVRPERGHPRASLPALAACRRG